MSRFRSNIEAARRAGWLTLVALVLPLIAGCPATTTQVDSGPCPPRDESAKLVTIGADMTVDQPILRLSKSAGDAAQWYNTGTEPVSILFPGEPVALEIPAGAYSHVQRVNREAEEGQYPYTVRKTAGGPPTTPQFDVGP